jgi:hypothetical protein
VRVLEVTTARAGHVAGLLPLTGLASEQDTRPHRRAGLVRRQLQELRQFLVEGAAVAPDEADLEVVLPQCCSS